MQGLMHATSCLLAPEIPTALSPVLFKGKNRHPSVETMCKTLCDPRAQVQPQIPKHKLPTSALLSGRTKQQQGV